VIKAAGFIRRAEYAKGAMPRIIFHLDMDAFFAAIEQRDDPSLRGKPVIVGSPPDRRGVVCAASYEARKFGVRSAMPSMTAGRLCPKGIFVRPRINHYREESKAIMAIVARAGAVMEPMSIDEAYLDFSEALQARSFADQDEALQAALPVARKLKADIQSERALTASVGIASNKFLAKIASDFQKPNGLTLIREREKVEFLRTMPVRAIHGVGKVTEQVLINAGIRTIGDLQNYQSDLRALVGSWAPRLKQLAFGEDDRPIEVDWDIKSISSEETFDVDTDDRAILRRCLKEQADDIARRLQRKRMEARTVQVKVRYRNFSTLTRQISLQDPITEAAQIYRLACYLLARDKLVTGPLRLLGTGVSGLTESSVRQLALF
jgi:DNA polymerase-4